VLFNEFMVYTIRQFFTHINSFFRAEVYVLENNLRKRVELYKNQIHTTNNDVK
jgi:hypothetical protein